MDEGRNRQEAERSTIGHFRSLQPHFHDGGAGKGRERNSDAARREKAQRRTDISPCRLPKQRKKKDPARKSSRTGCSDRSLE